MAGGKTSSLCMYVCVCSCVCLCLCLCACMLFVPVISVYARVYCTILSSESMGLSAPSPLTGLLLIMLLTVLFAVHTYLHIYDVMPYACLVIASPPLPPLPLCPSSPLLPSPPLPLLSSPPPPGVHLLLWHVHLCAGRSAVAQPAGTDAGHPRPLRVLHLRSVPQTGPLTSTGVWEEGGERRGGEWRGGGGRGGDCYDQGKCLTQ